MSVPASSSVDQGLDGGHAWGCHAPIARRRWSGGGWWHRPGQGLGHLFREEADLHRGLVIDQTDFDEMTQRHLEGLHAFGLMSGDDVAQLTGLPLTHEIADGVGGEQHLVGGEDVYKRQELFRGWHLPRHRLRR